jgi:hypothetical protein
MELVQGLINGTYVAYAFEPGRSQSPASNVVTIDVASSEPSIEVNGNGDGINLTSNHPAGTEIKVYSESGQFIGSVIMPDLS